MGKTYDRTRPRAYHIKNTGMVCLTPKTLYDALSKLFLSNSFSTLLIDYIQHFTFYFAEKLTSAFSLIHKTIMHVSHKNFHK